MGTLSLRGPDPVGPHRPGVDLPEAPRALRLANAGEAPAADGATIFLDNPRVDSSANATLLQAGLVYPAFYDTLPASLRMHLAEFSRAARAANAGIWARATADPDGPATVTDAAGLQTQVIWPKLFRRLVPYFASGATSLDGFDAWLRTDPVDRDDAILLLDPPEAGNLHDVIRAVGQQVQLTRWPEDFVIAPDPAPPGTATGPRRYVAGDVVIVAALPDPVGVDAGRESVSLANVTATDIDLTGWRLSDGTGQAQELSGTLAAGEVHRVALTAGRSLGNRGGSASVVDPGGTTIDHVTYTQAQVVRGRTMIFGRS